MPNIDLTMLLVAAISALGGGGAAAMFSRWVDKGEAEIERVRSDLAECNRSHQSLRERCDELELRLRIVEAASPSYLARWVKGQDRRLLWLNDRAYLTMFAPLGFSREQVLNRTFEELYGDGNGEAIAMLAELDRAAIRAPNETQSIAIQLHPELPMMVVVKVAFVGPDGLLQFEGTSFVPNYLNTESAGAVRQREQRRRAAAMLFDIGEDGHGNSKG